MTFSIFFTLASCLLSASERAARPVCVQQSRLCKADCWRLPQQCSSRHSQQQQQLRPAAALLQKAEPAFPASSAAASSSDAMRKQQQQQASPTQTLAWQQGNPSPPPPQLRRTGSSDARWCAADFSAENYSASLPQTRLESLRLRQKAASHTLAICPKQLAGRRVKIGILKHLVYELNS